MYLGNGTLPKLSVFGLLHSVNKTKNEITIVVSSQNTLMVISKQEQH
jgi:hypothetical protein